MTSSQTFSWKFPRYFRTLTGNIFLGIFSCWSRKFWTARVQCYRKRDNFAKDLFGIFKILEQLYLSEHFQKSTFHVEFSPVVVCKLQLCNVIKRGLHFLHFVLLMANRTFTKALQSSKEFWPGLHRDQNAKLYIFFQVPNIAEAAL